MLTAAQVAPLLGLSVRAVYDIDESDLPRYRVGAGRGAVRFDPADVEQYRLRCRSAGTPATSAGASSSTVSLRVDATALAAYFRKAGVKPKLTLTTSRKPRDSGLLRLVSSDATP